MKTPPASNPGGTRAFRRPSNAFPALVLAALFSWVAPTLIAEDSSTMATNALPVAATVAGTEAAKAPAKPAQRAFAESDLLNLVTATLQKDYVKDAGDLELRLIQPWITRQVPNEQLSINVLDMPITGVTSSFLMRFELRAAKQTIGTYQLAIQARVWREIWVARTVVNRGELVGDADLEKQRRDVLAIHEPLADFPAGDTSLQLSESLQAGSPLLVREIKLRPVIHRGQSTDAVIEDGTLSITMKVEAMEDGIPGQIIRARNPQSRRDIRGKVINEKTILVTL